MSSKSKQRVDADNVVLKVQTRSFVQARIASEIEEAEMARAEKTARLKALRLDSSPVDARFPSALRPAL